VALLAGLCLAVFLPGGAERAQASAAAAVERIEVDPLAVIGADTTGTLSPDEGALPVDMWRDTSRSLIDTLLPRLPGDTPSPAMRSLMRRLLLTGAAMPAGEAEPGRLLDDRASALWRIGATADLLRLISATPRDHRSPRLWRLETDAHLLAGNAGAACRIAEDRIATDPEDYWQEVMGFCQALAGDKDGASLTVALLAEREKDVATYRALIEALGAGRVAIPKDVEPTPLNIAIFRAAGRSPDLKVAEEADLAVLVTIARAESFIEPLRLAAAERAVAVGLLPAEELYPLLGRIADARMPVASGRTAAAKVPPASTAAVLHEALVADGDDRDRRAAAAQVLTRARENGDWLQATHFVAPWLLSATPATQPAGSAETVVPALLVLNERARAEAWIDGLAGGAGGDPAAASALQELLPLARIARLKQTQAWSAVPLSDWWQAEHALTGTRLRSERVLAMLQATGEAIPDSLWQSLLQGPAQVSGAHLDAAFRTQLARAGAGRRVGEAALLALVGLGRDGPQTLGTSSLELVVSSLRAAGLEADARALAVEAVSAR
jgi:hypothetical protein